VSLDEAYSPTAQQQSTCICCQLPQAAEKGEEGDGRKKWHEEKQKKRAEELARLGLTPEQAHRLESAEVAEAKAKKKVCGGGVWLAFQVS
jgi:hypothetical protein